MDTFEIRGPIAPEGSSDESGLARPGPPYGAARAAARQNGVPDGKSPDLSSEDVTALASAARGGDREALKRLYGLYKDRAYRIALLLLSNREAAEEVTEEAFVRYYHNTAAEHATFPQWVYKTVVGICVGHTSARGAVECERLSVNDPDRHAALRRRIAAALACLEPRARVAFVLREGVRLSYRQIAAVMDDEPEHVAHYLADARAGLAEVLEQIEFEAWNIG